ncbi:enoyl-CoA hydratase/isomerase family protein [Oceanobacillus senegalensis]|uniref:enoyl-CoA hydratase/isomerase family protein n=1 Tax=Oceanobacillus senegalensis TaxID=1936063 RepID=UPI000A309B56|nr:enoyl-CoA hydratase [Oceanobacillus senegalensis]
MNYIETKDLLVEIKEGVLHLTLNRPDSLNAFSAEMITGLKEAIQLAKTEASIHVVTISGSGRAFSAGGDVKNMGQKDPLGTYDHIGNLNELILSMKELEKPIIAAVHGYAAGAGFNLALACDIILSAEESKFILSFSKVGLISDGGGLYFLPRLIGPYRAKELLFNAEPITASEAYSLGIVNHIYSLAEFPEEVNEYALKLARGPSKAYGFIKKLADKSLHSTLEEILELERITQATVATTADHREGVLAFKEKRTPNFGK